MRYHRRVYHEWTRTNSIVRVIGWSDGGLFGKMADRFSNWECSRPGGHFSHARLVRGHQSNVNVNHAVSSTPTDSKTGSAGSKDGDATGGKSRRTEPGRQTAVPANIFTRFPSNTALLVSARSTLQCTSPPPVTWRCVSVPLGVTSRSDDVITPLSSVSASTSVLSAAVSCDVISAPSDSDAMLKKTPMAGPSPFPDIFI